MAKAPDHPSTLFRSLRPDDEDFQSSTSSAAREAEQRWPLFKAVAPQKQQATPLLSPQERSLWSTTQKPSGHERKPALSVPATGNKLAQSLSKMAGRPAAATPARSLLTTRQEEPYQEPIPAPQVFAPAKPAKKRSLFSKDASTEMEPPYQEQEAVRPPPKFGRNEPVRGRGSLFSKEAATTEKAQPDPGPARAPQKPAREEPARGRNSLFSKGVAPAREEPAEVRSAARSGDSLTSLFSRLEGPEEPVKKPVGKASSFFGRPGKR